MDKPRITRRRLLQSGAAALPLPAASAAFPEAARAAVGPAGATHAAHTAPASAHKGAKTASTLQIPSEIGPHTRTFMAWPALSSIWGRQLAAVRPVVPAAA
jgi:agmatine deiminase